jgi:hypothetical protein
MNKNQMSEYRGCRGCRHYLGELDCSAFPEGIPLIILSGKIQHTEVLAKQKNTIVYDAIKKSTTDKMEE